MHEGVIQLRRELYRSSIDVLQIIFWISRNNMHERVIQLRKELYSSSIDVLQLIAKVANNILLGILLKEYYKDLRH